MVSSHKVVDYVRQLDRTALKNCMELALLRHEKDLSVKKETKQRNADLFQSSIDLETRRVLAAEEAKRSLIKANREQLL